MTDAELTEMLERYRSILWDDRRVMFSYTSTEPVRTLLEEDFPAVIRELQQARKLLCLAELEAPDADS